MTFSNHRALRATGVIVMFLVAFALRSQSAFSSVIDPSLRDLMSGASQDTLLSVVIRPYGTLNSAELKADVLRQYPTRAEQHREVISALVKASSESQELVLDDLKSPAFGTGVQDVRTYWIDNVITARMTPTAIEMLSVRPDIESIRVLPDPALVTPLSVETAGNIEPGITQSHVKATKADSVWLAGYTGKGRLVGSIDTGVQGTHTALTKKWRGHNGGTLAESWYDPVYPDTVPRYFGGSGAGHGTQVMGLMVAVIPSGLDTIGVCPDCEWISAAAIDIPCPDFPYTTCGNLFDALQWIADPDGDPNTEWDSPDAVANPWGAMTRDAFDGCQATTVGCSDLFWNAIDNIEAAGTLMVFAAGNEGDCGPMSIRNPANRVASETNAFSVGMVDARFDLVNPPVDALSSRGPSDCDGTSIKPEVTAPGVNLRTTTPPNSLSNIAYGTSFSTSLVTAGAALLREYNPNTTVDQIKSAMLSGAKDLGAVGPDNGYGHGLLDLMGALRNLPPNTQPALYVKRDGYVPPSPGTDTELLLTLRNCGTPATGVSVALSSLDPRLVIIDGEASYDDMPAYGDSATNSADPYHVSVNASCLPGERLAMEIEISAEGGYSRVINGAIFVGPIGDGALFTHDAGRFRMTVGATGAFGQSSGSLEPRPDGIGYFYNADPTPTLFEGGFLIAMDEAHVSDHVRNESGSPNPDFRVDPGGLLSIQEPGEFGAEETRSAFDDSQADNPIGLFFEQRTFVSDVDEHADYLIVEYSLYNRSGSPINGLHCGIFCDWDFPWVGTEEEPVASRDGGGFDPTIGLGWMRHRDENRLRALCVLSETPLSGYKYFSNFDEIYDGFSDLEKWEALTGGTAHALPAASGDGSHLIGAGPIDLSLDMSERVAFAIIGGTSEAQIKQSAKAARAAYAAMRDELALDLLPGMCPNVISISEPRELVRPRSAKAIPGPSAIEMAILSRDGWDATALDAVTITMQGLHPLRSRVADIGTPLDSRESGECDCPIPLLDGMLDLVLSYDRGEFLASLGNAPGTYGVTVRAADATTSLRSGRVCVQLTTDLVLQPSPTKHMGTTAFRFGGPNPFNASTSIEFSTAEAAPTTLMVFDILGRRVKTLIDNIIVSGEHSVEWNAEDDNGREVASGVYFAILTVGGESQSLKLVLLK